LGSIRNSFDKVFIFTAPTSYGIYLTGGSASTDTNTNRFTDLTIETAPTGAGSQAIFLQYTDENYFTDVLIVALLSTDICVSYDYSLYGSNAPNQNTFRGLDCGYPVVTPYLLNGTPTAIAKPNIVTIYTDNSGTSPVNVPGTQGNDNTVQQYNGSIYAKNALGTTPTVSSCGTGGLVTAGSADMAGTIYIGTGATSCQVTYGNARLVAAKACVASSLGGAVAAGTGSYTTSGFIVYGTAGAYYSYICM
jgi:hypothetical protein